MCGILLMTIHWRSSVRPRPHTGAPVSGAQTLEVQCVAFTYLEVQTLEAQTLDFQWSCIGTSCRIILPVFLSLTDFSLKPC